MRDEAGASDVAQAFRVAPGTRVQLDERDPADKAGLSHKAAAREETEKDAAAIDALQDRLYAERRRALLVILQGTDTSGKDGTIRSVFNRTGPLGVSVTAFGRPDADDLAHDFLWRVHAACPRRGTIGIFNRSHYEDVLVARVRGLAPPDAIEARYGQINDFEKLLAENGTTILKFMLNISKDEQAERLRARLEEPESRWKFNPDDLEDRKHWDDYRRAYEIMLERCSTPH
ncbi:MAG TPA: PPK2 family polyphosphate kinase, partial [Beijerinckiaceae bacterium]